MYRQLGCAKLEVLLYCKIHAVGLGHDKLITVAAKIKEYLPRVTSIGGFARIADIKRKTQEEINELHALGYDGISIGTVSAPS